MLSALTHPLNPERKKGAAAGFAGFPGNFYDLF